MITKAPKLRNFVIFQDFIWKADIPEFKRFNLIYGWNRSGKTTMSRCFSACEKQTISFNRYPYNGEFELKLDNGLDIKNGDVVNCNMPIKVFNTDFIEDNIAFDPSNACNAIVYVSEEDIEKTKKLSDLKDNLLNLDIELKTAEKNRKAKEDSKNGFLQSLGREISNVLFDKTYNKLKAENQIQKVGIDNFSDKILSEDQKKKFMEISRSDAKQKQNSLMQYQPTFTLDGETISSFDDLFSVLKNLIEKKVVSQTLERLKDDETLNSWVKKGFDLHKARDQKEKCFFCEKPLDGELLDSLSKHFSKDYEDLQSTITELVSKLKDWGKGDINEKNQEMYPDLRGDYENQAAKLNTIISNLNKWIDQGMKKLEEKFNNPLSIIELPEKPEDIKKSYNVVVNEINKIIEDHNTKVANHAAGVKSAKDLIELHLLGEAIQDQNYKKMKEDLEGAVDSELSAKANLDKVKEEIIQLERETANTGKALEKINKHLEEFFGRKEIQLALDDSKKGYIIKRDGQIANNLSEGEKTAIAFSYFVAKAQEKNFKIKDGIVFIDDPISSLDSNFIYHCFSLLKNYFGSVGQLFISTHNFELFNLLKKWFIEKNRSLTRSKKDEVCCFYMIENYIDGDKRKARIKKLENTLLNYNSEYHFLFDLLYTFANNDSPEYKDLYTISNIARRFLEIFTNFKIPTTGDLASKIDALRIDEDKISSIERGKVYKLIQEFSHGSDPTSAIEHKDKIESQEAIKVLLNIVKESDLTHYNLLEKSIRL